MLVALFLLASVVSHAAATDSVSYTTAQCSTIRPSNANNLFANGVRSAFAENCTVARTCAQNYCICVGRTLTGVTTGNVVCAGNAAVTCGVQGLCAQTFTDCLWAAAFAARSWGQPAMDELLVYTTRVTNGSTVNPFWNGTNGGQSCAWYACNLAANSSAAPCTVWPEYACPVPVGLADELATISDNTVTDNANRTVTTFRLTIPGDFNIFFFDTTQNGKLRLSFTTDLQRTFQTDDVSIASFANGSLVSTFSVTVLTNSRLAMQVVKQRAITLSGTTAWLRNTAQTYNTQIGTAMSNPTLTLLSTTTNQGLPSTVTCSVVCFQLIVILGGSAVLVLFWVFSCYCCCAAKKTALPQQGWSSKAPCAGDAAAPAGEPATEMQVRGRTNSTANRV